MNCLKGAGKMKLKKIAALLLAGAAMLGAVGCGGSGGDKPAAADSKQSLKGKELVMYVSFHEDTAKDLARLFKEKTGCEVKFIRLPTGEAMARLMAEKDAPKADIWLGGTADAHALAKAQGITEKYVSPNDNMVPDQYRDKDGFWKGVYLETLSIGVNTARFEKEFAPKGIAMPTKLEDLLNPAFKGEIIMPDPAKSGTGYTFLSSVLQSMGDEQGWKFLKELKGNVAQLTPSGFTPAQKVGAGEFLITVNFLSDQTLINNKGQKLNRTVYTNAGWSMCAVSKLKTTAHDDAAKAFIDFMLTKEAGDSMAKTANAIACNPDSTVPQGSKPLKELPLFANYDFAKAGDVKTELCEKFANL